MARSSARTATSSPAARPGPAAPGCAAGQGSARPPAPIRAAAVPGGNDRCAAPPGRWPWECPRRRSRCLVPTNGRANAGHRGRSRRRRPRVRSRSGTSPCRRGGRCTGTTWAPRPAAPPPGFRRRVPPSRPGPSGSSAAPATRRTAPAPRTAGRLRSARRGRTVSCRAPWRKPVRLSPSTRTRAAVRPVRSRLNDVSRRFASAVRVATPSNRLVATRYFSARS